MFLEGLDMIGASLTYKKEIDAFSAQHWARHPWLKDVASRVRQRLDQAAV
jgi:3-isopropylmalate/(R)-2-methylmalate dehydratase small subunit